MLPFFNRPNMRQEIYEFFLIRFVLMKKLLLLLLVILFMSACNNAVCPAYSDAANNMKNNFLQKGNHRADGINRVYRDSSQKKLR